MGSNQIKTDAILFFHGFWGQASDWNFLKEHGFQKDFAAINYIQESLLGPQNYLSDWGQNFFDWIDEKAKLFFPAGLQSNSKSNDESTLFNAQSNSMTNSYSKRISAVGYSQGGRLLLQALALHPDRFEKVVLISSHPGLTSFSEKEQRLAHDRQWAQKFRSQPWDQIQKEWDSQGVFDGKSSPQRDESQYNREELALCFENWSLAHQQDFRQTINSCRDKIHIILGAEDAKYVSLYKGFLDKNVSIKMEKGAAHRVPFDQPQYLVETLNSLFN